MRTSIIWVGERPAETNVKTLAFADVKRLAEVEDDIQLDMAAEAIHVMRTVKGWFSDAPSLLVTDVDIRTAADLEVLVRFLIDPAYVGGFDLVLVGSEPSKELFGSQPDIATSMLWERFDYVKQRAGSRAILDGIPPLTPIEELLLKELRDFGLSPRVQYDIPPFRVDFAFEDVNLAIEADGREWHDSDKDQTRDAKLQELGWHVMHFSGAEIWADAKSCVEQVIARRGTLSDEKPENHSGDPEGEKGGYKSGLGRSLDAEQDAAVTARPGVVQVIAPAGSGKTTVLVNRVQFLLSHGMPATRILSTTFNKDAAGELRKRFDAVGISTDAETRTFHSLGHDILKQEGHLPPNRLSTYSWKKLARTVSIETDQWIEPEELENWIGYFKLIEMKAPNELTVDQGDDLARARLRAYELYERDRERRKAWSYDDLIFLAVKLLQADFDVRARWQKRWWYILVDEYQDIEPAQEQLILLLSNPHDNLFIVGDEDQCIYTWRRADVRRIMTLYRRFPSLKQSLLKVNYRSGKDIVSASRVLIENNKLRFAKDISAHRTDPGKILRIGFSEDPLNQDQLDHAFGLVRDCENPHEMAVLSRTNALLRDLAIRCITSGIEIKANDRILRPSLVEEVVLAYLLMCLRPASAEPSHIETALRNPNVYLMESHASLLLNSLRAGKSFVDAFEALPIPKRDGWRRSEQIKVAPRFDRLKLLSKASLAMVHLRRELGLDDHFDARAREGASSEDADALNAVSGLADRSASTTDFLAELLRRRDALQKARDGDGVELTSIHGAKGREWSQVLFIGADEQRLPLASVIENDRPGFTMSNGWEDERRLAYVAMTRAKDTLTICWSDEPSPFVLEALDNANPSVLESATRSRLADRQEAREKAAKISARESSRSRGARAFVAKFVSTCHLCGSHIVPGEKAIPHDGQTVHTGCVRDAELLPPRSRAKEPEARGAGAPRPAARRPSAGGGQSAGQEKRGFPAKFPGWCFLCEKKYPEGELIIPMDGKYVHVACGLSDSSTERSRTRR